MKKNIALITLSLGLTLLTPNILSGVEPPFVVSQAKPLRQVQVRRNSLGLDEQLWQMYGGEGDRLELVKSIDRSLSYFKSSDSVEDYENYLVPGITRERVIRSLTRFRQLLLNSS